MVAVRLALLFAVIVWGWTFVATKILVAYVTPIELLALRFALGFPILLAIAVVRGRAPRFGRREAALALAGAGLMTLHFLVQIRGLETATATNTGWIIAFAPLAIALLSAAILRESPSRRQLAGVGVATVGVVVLVSGGDPQLLAAPGSAGDWLILLSAFTWALFTITTRGLARDRDPLVVTAAVMAPAALFTVAWTATFSDWRRFAALPENAIVALLFLAIPGMALAQWCWQSGVGRLGATRAGVFLYIEPLATTALAVPYLGEPLTAFTLVGGALVLAGVYIAQRRSARTDDPRHDPAHIQRSGP